MILGIIESIVGAIGVIAFFKKWFFIVGICGVLCLLLTLHEFNKGALNSLVLEFISSAIGALIAYNISLPIWFGIASALCFESLIVTIATIPALYKQWKLAYTLAKLDSVRNKFSKTIIENQYNSETTDTELPQQEKVKVKVKPVRKNNNPK